jgi:protein FAM50
MAGDATLTGLAQKLAHKHAQVLDTIAVARARIDADVVAVQRGLDDRFVVGSSSAAGLVAPSLPPAPAEAAGRPLPASSAPSRRPAPRSLLSFGTEEEEGGEEGEGGGVAHRGVSGKRPAPALSVVSEPARKRRLGADPSADTTGLRDPEATVAAAALAVQLAREWEEAQEAVKREPLEITFSYWDGTGHRRSIVVPKGSTVGKFLEAARAELATSFPELRSLPSDGLMFIKEDLILPAPTTFYALIVAKARGKSGPLFTFDVHDDVRLLSDARVEKDEAHPGKIVRRSWYNANKHVFPASRWEVYDPSRATEGYTIRGHDS